jgi:hypothetical protein
MSRSKLACLDAILAGVAPIDLPVEASAHVGDYWERIGYLVRTGHMNQRFVYEQFGPLAQVWWRRLVPSIVAWRERDKQPRVWSDWEWLVRRLEELDLKHGVSHPFDSEAMASGTARSASQMREAIKIEESLRTVTVRLEPMPVPVTMGDRPTARRRTRPA